MNIILPIGELTEQDKEDLRYLIQDAMHDFVRAREGKYVANRYPDMSPEFRAKKENQVARRRLLAARLSAAAFDMKIEKPTE